MPLWHMETEEAFEAFLRVDRTAHGGKRLFADEVSRNAWLTAITEPRDPSLRSKGTSRRVLPLP